MKKISIKTVLIVWASIATAMLGSFFLFPHDEINLTSVANNMVQLFLFVICVALFRSEPNRPNKFLFLNFALLFGLFIFFHLYNFVPGGSSFVKFFLFQYVGVATYYSLLAFALVYLTIDVLFRDFTTFKKYFVSISIVVGFVLVYFHPIILNPMYIYSTDDARDYFTVEKTFNKYQEEMGEVPNVEALIAGFSSDPSKSFSAISSTQTELVEARIVELYPYLLSQQNYAVLLIRPLYKDIIYMCVIGLAFILVFFGYQSYRDPPQGAYIEKLMLLFLIFLSVEICHAWSFVNVVQWSYFATIVDLGQKISATILFLISLVFLLRLKFITSPNGQFYEQEIATSPKGVTRWRDMFDELILAYFVNSSNPKGRLFVNKNQVT